MFFVLFFEREKHGCIKLIVSDIKETFTLLQNTYISNKCGYYKLLSSKSAYYYYFWNII